MLFQSLLPCMSNLRQFLPASPICRSARLHQWSCISLSLCRRLRRLLLQTLRFATTQMLAIMPTLYDSTTLSRNRVDPMLFLVCRLRLWPHPCLVFLWITLTWIGWTQTWTNCPVKELSDSQESAPTAVPPLLSTTASNAAWCSIAPPAARPCNGTGTNISANASISPKVSETRKAKTWYWTLTDWNAASFACIIPRVWLLAVYFVLMHYLICCCPELIITLTQKFKFLFLHLVDASLTPWGVIMGPGNVCISQYFYSVLYSAVYFV